MSYEEDKKQDISDLEKLANGAKFNEFTKQIVQKKDNLRNVKEDFLGEKCSQCDNEIKIKNPKLNIEMVCPNCNEKLFFLMPNGTRLCCNKCDKIYMNNNGTVGEETLSPYINKDALY